MHGTQRALHANPSSEDPATLGKFAKRLEENAMKITWCEPGAVWVDRNLEKFDEK